MFFLSFYSKNTFTSQCGHSVQDYVFVRVVAMMPQGSFACHDAPRYIAGKLLHWCFIATRQKYLMHGSILLLFMTAGLESYPTRLYINRPGVLKLLIL